MTRVVIEDAESFLVEVSALRELRGRARRGASEVVAESMSAHGQYAPVTVNRRTMEVLRGNEVVAAARWLGWEYVAATYVDVDDEEAHRIALVDNRSSDLASYDAEALAQLLTALPDLAGTGYDDAALAELLAQTAPRPALTDVDDAPPLPDEPITRDGDVFVLGDHRVMCGDATSATAIATLLEDQRVDAVWTDPPYGVSYVGGTKDRLTIANDDLRADELFTLLDDAFRCVGDALRPGGVFYVCSPSGALETTFRLALETARLELRQQLVWVKDRFVLGRQDYHGRHETILHGWAEGAEPPLPPLYDDAHGTVLYGWSSGAGHAWEGGRRQDTVWEVPRPSASRLHPTMKPVALVQRAIENSTRPGEVVLDSFGGSGSTLIAAYTAGRRSRLMEMDPRYVDVICRRWQEHTGQVPLRDGRRVDFTGPDRAAAGPADGAG